VFHALLNYPIYVIINFEPIVKLYRSKIDFHLEIFQAMVLLYLTLKVSTTFRYIKEENHGKLGFYKSHLKILTILPIS